MASDSRENIDAIRLPDGTRFQMWQDGTDYQKVYVVDQQHHAASDENPGTEEAPFLTIQSAADVVGPGEKVLIKSGVYREWVQPRRGGAGPDGMISYEAAPGAEATIRGSQVLEATWSNEDLTGSVSVWRADLPEAFFEGDHPFAVANTTEADFDIMRWARGERGRVPHTLPRAMVFQNGRRLTQLGSADELRRVPGAFWIDTSEHRLHVNPFDREDPNGAQFEVTTQQFLFNPLVRDLGYIRVSGLTFEHAGNGFIRSGNGAVSTWGGHHWIIEDNTVRHINSVGIEMGGMTEEGQHGDQRAELETTTGSHLVRRNQVYDCGTGGIQGTLVVRSLLAGNHIHDCGWQEVQHYLETGGIKILMTVDTVVQCNHIHHCQAAPGMWIDFANRNTRICRNLLHDIAAPNGAIFFEASKVLNLIDNNVIYDVEGSGVYQRDCDELVIAHNLTHNCSHAGIRMRKTPTRDRVGVVKKNRVVRNVITQCRRAFDYEVMENTSDHNVVAGISDDSDLAKWRASGLDTNSPVVGLDVAIDPENPSLTWSSTTGAAPTMPRDELMAVDYFGRPHPSGDVPAGPFIEGWSHVSRRLRLLPSR